MYASRKSVLAAIRRKSHQEPDFDKSIFHALQVGRWHKDPLRFVPFLPKAWARKLEAQVTRFLDFRPSSIPGAGMGVFASTDLPAGFRIPYIGVVYPSYDDYGGSDKYSMCDGHAGVIDGHPSRTVRKLNYAPRINEPPAATNDEREAAANMHIQHEEEGPWSPLTPTVLCTRRPIPAGEELLLYYGDAYERDWACTP